MKSGSGWERKFEDPILLPGGRKLVTLRDAAAYITSLPKKESDLPEWQTAIEVLMLVSRSGPTIFARIGVMRALNRGHVREFIRGRLRETSSSERWRGAAEKPGEPPQVLRGCCKQHFVPDTAQAPQPKPVEPENPFHVRKSHLDLLALAARLLEGFRIG